MTVTTGGGTAPTKGGGHHRLLTPLFPCNDHRVNVNPRPVSVFCHLRPDRGEGVRPVAARHMRQLRPGLTCHFGKTLFFWPKTK